MSNQTKINGLDYDLIGLNMSEIKELVVATYMGGLKRNRKPKTIMCWGAPGEGKTFTMFAAAREIGRRLGTKCDVIDIPTSTLEPCDVSGIPFPVHIDGKETFARYLAPEWAWLISKEYEEHEKKQNPQFVAPPVLVMFDDLTTAHFQTQSAFFKGLHEGKWGFLHQRNNVMTIGCGNRVEDNAGANDMPTPLANKIRHCYANPTAKEWLKWGNEFREEGEDGIPGETRIHPIVTGYIRTRNNVLREFSVEIANRSEKAFASHRTWEDVSELFWEAEILPSNPIFLKAVMGIIGRGQAIEFSAYLQNTTSLIPPEEIVKNPQKARIPSKRNLDAMYATGASLELHIKQNPKHWKAGLIYALRKEMVPDIGICLAQAIAEVVMGFPSNERTKAMGDDIFSEIFDRYNDLFDIVESYKKEKE